MLAEKAPSPRDLEREVNDRHLQAISKQLNEKRMVNELCPVLGLKSSEINSIRRLGSDTK